MRWVEAIFLLGFMVVALSQAVTLTEAALDGRTLRAMGGALIVGLMLHYAVRTIPGVRR